MTNAQTTCDPSLFGGSSVFAELNATIADAGVGPIAFYQHWLTHSGMNTSSAVARDVAWTLYALYYLYAMDGLSGASLRVAEHIVRRITMSMKAVKKNQKNPDFTRLETYSEHMVDPAGGLKTSGDFDRYTADRLKVARSQNRMAREKEAATDTHATQADNSTDDKAPRPQQRRRKRDLYRRSPLLCSSSFYSGQRARTLSTILLR